MAVAVFPWSEAEKRALAGARVRLTTWTDYWLFYADGLWFISEEDETRVVEASDFQAGNFVAPNWTADPYEGDDACQRPPPRSEFAPATLAVSAELVAVPIDLLRISAFVGPGSFGWYRLSYYVNGQRVAADVATEPTNYIRALEVDPEWLEGDIFVEVRLESALPLPPWSFTAHTTISFCPIGTIHNPGAYMKLYGFPGAASGALPKSVPGTSLAGLTVVQGADHQLSSDGTALFCDFPAYGSVGAPYAGYDGIQFHFADVVRGDFDFSYEYLYTNNASFSGAKNVMCISADPTAWDSPGVHIGTWEDKFSFPYTRLRMFVDEAWHLHIAGEDDPPEAGGANLPTAYDTWHTRRMVKRGDTIEYSDGAVGPFKVQRCRFAVRGHIGLIISGGIRVKNLNLRAP